MLGIGSDSQTLVSSTIFVLVVGAVMGSLDGTNSDGSILLVEFGDSEVAISGPWFSQFKINPSPSASLIMLRKSK